MTVFDDRQVRADYAQCRGSNHWLEWFPSDPSARRNGAVPVWWRCVHCGTERHDELHATTLELVGRRYVYPDGYLVTQDEKPTRATWRAAYLRGLGAISDAQAARARRYRKDLWQSEGEG
jgi:predicted secreted Zn-dependent protease